ncbi:reverse transcriptase domain-containing protein [Tanacetum coccineum]
MADHLRPIEELLRIPILGIEDAIVVPAVLADQFELKPELLDFIRAAETWLENEPPNSITSWDDLVSKFLNRFFPHSKTRDLRKEITNFQQVFGETFTEAWERFKNLTIIEKKSKVQTSRNKPQVASASESSAQDAHITALTKQVEALLSLHRPVNSVQNSCETCGDPHPYYECQAADGYTKDVYATSGTYNQGGNAYQPQGNQNLLSYRSNNYLGPPGFNQGNNQNQNNQVNNQGNNQGNYQNNQNRNQNQNQNQYNQGSQNQGYNHNRVQNYNQGNNYNQNQGYNQNQAQTNVPSLEEMIYQHMRTTEARIQQMKTQNNQQMQQMQNHNTQQIQQLKTQNTQIVDLMSQMQKVLHERPQGALPSNTEPNPREQVNYIMTRSGLTTVKPSIPPPVPPTPRVEVEKEPETLIDKVHITSPASTVHVPPPGFQPVSPPKPKEDPKPNPHQPKIPYPSGIIRQNILIKNNVQWIAEDVIVKVKKFNFLADFIIVDFEADPRVPIILGRPFFALQELLWTLTRKITLRSIRRVVAVPLHLILWSSLLSAPKPKEDPKPNPHQPPIPSWLQEENFQALENPTGRADHFVYCIDIVDSLCDKFPIENNSLSGNPTPSSNSVVESLSPSLTPFWDIDLLLEETDAFRALDSIPPYINDGIYDSEGDILFLEGLLNDEIPRDLPPLELNNDPKGDILFLENLLKDEPLEVEESAIYPLIREPSNTFLMGDEEIKVDPSKEIDDPVPNLKVSKTPLDSLDSILDSYDTSYTNPSELDSEYTLNYDKSNF